jgi:crotonobetainyl-CoA:carnitine CoA-transferase CaiB-like acyl-CoA transferase
VLTFVLAGPGGVSGFWSLAGMNITRSSEGINLGHIVSRTIYSCKEGYVAVSTLFGLHFPTLIDLMKAENAAGFLEDPKWKTATRFSPLPGQWQCTQEDADAAEGIFAAWLRTHTRDEVTEMAHQHNLLIFPVLTVADNVGSEQLAARDYFTSIKHDDTGPTVTYPGAPIVLSETPWELRRRAPRLGEHNEEVYSRIGVDAAELSQLRNEGVV